VDGRIAVRQILSALDDLRLADEAPCGDGAWAEGMMHASLIAIQRAIEASPAISATFPEFVSAFRAGRWSELESHRAAFEGWST
jgi:hypothetical protein